MREIKFRGITFKGDFVYGDLTNDASGLSFNESQWIRNNLTENSFEESLTAYWKETTKRIRWREGNAFCNAPVKPETVGQFTGLLDKNGVEIYEGDIFTHNWHDSVEVVAWNEKCAGYVLPYNFDDEQYVMLGDLGVKVIGNIYQNPELLEYATMQRQDLKPNEQE